MKRALILLLAALLALSAGCGAPGGGGGVDPVRLGAELTEKAAGLPPMETVENDAELFRYLSDMDYSLVSGYYLAYAASGSAEEIAVLSLKDAADSEAARASLERHLAGRLGLFRVYGPEEAALVENAVIAVSGGTLGLFVCDNAGELGRAFRESA